MWSKTFIIVLILQISFLLCYIGEEIPRKGDEVIICGRLFHTNTPIVTWMDEGGYDAYRVECRFKKFNESSYEKCVKPNSPNRYGIRDVDDEATRERIRGGGWDLKTLQQYVNKIVVHYDVAGYAKSCFATLHDAVFLSAHFILDVDGTLYQTLDLKERAYHATIANPTSIGIEISNIGAYPPSQKSKFDNWYTKDEKGVRLVLPPNNWVRTPNFVGRPIRDTLISGPIHDQTLIQYDLTKEQYQALAKLIATLVKVFPKIKLDYPRDANGKLIRTNLSEAELNKFSGILGHFHVQRNKVDPGPAFQWDLVIKGAQAILNSTKH